MLKIFRCRDFQVKDLTRSGPRRGFVIPIPRDLDSVLLVADTDAAVNHEALGDKFVALNDEELLAALEGQSFASQEDFLMVVDTVKRLQQTYKKYEEEYPTSRKDFLIYEENTVAFDARSPFGKFILYRDNSRKYSISRRTEKIVCDFMMNNWKAEPVPEDSKCADQTRFF